MPPRDEQARLERWIKRLHELAQSCGDLDEAGAAEFLLQLEDALHNCPRALKTWFAPVEPKQTSARLRDAGANVSLVLGLCSGQMSYLLSRSVSGHSLVTVALPDLNEEASYVSSDLSISIAGALLTLILQIVSDEKQLPDVGRPVLN